MFDFNSGSSVKEPVGVNLTHLFTHLLKDGQGFIDVSCLLEHHALTLCFAHTLTARKIHQVKFAGLHMISTRNTNSNFLWHFFGRGQNG